MTDEKLKVVAPEGVTAATVQGTQYTIEKDGFFYMLEKHLHGLLEAGFRAVIEEGKEIVHGVAVVAEEIEEAVATSTETSVEGGTAGADTTTAEAEPVPATDTLENEGGKPAQEAETAPEETQGGDGTAPAAADTTTAA